MSIPKSLYETVRQRAQFRCEYCQFIQNARRQWMIGGLHPPNDDPQGDPKLG